MGNASLGFVVIAIVVLVLTIIPLCVIWSLNTLFGLSIQYGFDTWLAVIILLLCFKPSVEVTKNK